SEKGAGPARSQARRGSTQACDQASQIIPGADVAAPGKRVLEFVRMSTTRGAGRRRARVAVAALAFALAGCAHAPVRPAPPSRPPAGYDRLRDDLSAADTSGLPGKRIAIDPGHGGFFRGAVGVHGLTEAEVNLGVALDLKRLLTARGATVFLTRESDRDFLSPSDSSLRSDLAERM